MNNKFIVDDTNAGLRLDKFLSSKLTELSRSKIQKLIKDSSVMVNSKPTKSNYTLSFGDEIYLKSLDIKENTLEAEDVDLEVVYEDDSCFVINKAPFVTVYPGDSKQDLTGTIANAIKNRVSKDFDDKMRLGIVHRLDKDTSGLLLIAKTPEALSYLSAQFKKRTVYKAYQAVVWGILEHEEGIIEAPIGRDVKDRKKMSITSVSEGKMAVSKYNVVDVYDLENKKSCSLLNVEIETGRTHQIRVHLSSIGYPIVGDTAYGDRNVNKLFKRNYDLQRQFLHAYKLSFKSPSTKKEINLEIDLFNDLKSVVSLF